MPRRLACLLLVTSAACGGTDGDDALIALTSVPAGEVCETGGVALSVGRDANGNGTLDESEIDPSTSRVLCNGSAGASGTSGEDGLVSLVAVTEEPPGEACALGGSRVEAGVDADRSGTLEAAEITSTSYVCTEGGTGRQYFGDVMITSAADLEAIADVEVIVGSVYVLAYDADTLALPTLRVVTDVFHVSGSAPDLLFTSLRLPVLERARSLIVPEIPFLQTIEAPALVTVSSDLTVAMNPMLGTLDLGALRHARNVSITFNSHLPWCVVSDVVFALSYVQNVSTYMNDNYASECVSTQCEELAIEGLAGVFSCGAVVTWLEGRQLCDHLGGDLLWFTSQDELDALRAAPAGTIPPGEHFIGYSDADTEGTWVQARAGTNDFDPSPTNASFWSDGEPNGGVAEACAALVAPGAAKDLDCALERPVLCRVP